MKTAATTPALETAARPDRRIKNQGMNWLPQKKRLAIYLRDGLACAYCGTSALTGAKLTLDHLQPYSQGGSNREVNLVTCCMKCNQSRYTRSVASFAESVAAYLGNGITATGIMAHIAQCIARPLDMKTAGELVAREGSCFKVLQAAKDQQ